MLLGVRLLGCLLLPLLQRGRGDTEYGDLEEEGHYLYMDEDGPLEVLEGPARCQDTYQDWISLYCWAPFHAALMATPEGSRCRWDKISSTYSELSSCTQLLAQLLSCPWPCAVLDAFFLQRLPPPGRRLQRLQQRAGPGGLQPRGPRSARA
ncbi:receptor activity-modifying protein 1-like isoform X3 [Columba livia]|uniref:receptor activity-modifying protein 1-like isoform X3 n=1 Tax=Columba livia TaxID=8932 RepID=UPI0031BA79AF